MAPISIDLPTARMLAEIDEGIGWMTYNNPARHNAMSMEMQEAVPLILDRFRQDDAVRVVVLKGAGEKAFVSGADISEFEDKRSTPESTELYDQALGRAGASLSGLEKPLIAMIQGYCIGGGLAVALQADLRIASDDAQFGIPAARLGLGYRFAGIKALVSLVGPAYANEILFSARRFSAQEALRIGLVNRVVPRSRLETTTRELAQAISKNAPLTIRAAKYAVRQAVKDREARDLERCEALVQACFDSEDYVEGRRAFMEKRKPNFTGR